MNAVPMITACFCGQHLGGHHAETTETSGDAGPGLRASAAGGGDARGPARGAAPGPGEPGPDPAFVGAGAPLLPPGPAAPERLESAEDDGDPLLAAVGLLVVLAGLVGAGYILIGSWWVAAP